MLSPKYFIYLSLNSQNTSYINITNNPKVDAYFLSQLGFQEMHILQPPQPLWVAEKVFKSLSKYTNLTISKFQKLANSLLSEILSQKRISFIKHYISELKLPDFDIPDIASLFWGRSLLAAEIPELIKSNGFDLPWDPENWLQYLYLNLQIQREAAVTIDSLGLPYCRRCGETKGIIEDNCVFCGSKHCYTCTNCQTMGLAKSCIPLYSQPYPDQPQLVQNIHPQLTFDLTPPQQRASTELIAFFNSNQPRFLVWAVCGGGKTEVSFGIVAKVLSDGGRVLFAIPRKDVVVELQPRFQKAFPDINISALYGGSGERHTNNSMIIATTHQCLRFYQGFDLVILDEADAFPYQDSTMLHYAVEKSLKTNAKLVIMTATPSKTLIQKVDNGKLPYVSIPARHHRKPLIIPELIKENFKVPQSSKQAWEPPELIQKFILNLQSNGRRGLIFLPTIQLIEFLGLYLVKWALHYGITGDVAYSKTANRNEVKEDLLDGKILFIITSTIFERGITIPDLDVLVIYADNESIFDSRTLIQIAGRVGRQGEKGQVLFVGKTISGSMQEARRIIERMNREGLELGYLDRC